MMLRYGTERQGHAIDIVGMLILYIKSELLDMIRHDMLLILKYPSIIVDNTFFEKKENN